MATSLLGTPLGAALYDSHDVDLRAEAIGYRYYFEGRLRSAMEDVALLVAVVGDPPATRGYSGRVMRRRLRAAFTHLCLCERRVERCYFLQNLGFTATLSSRAVVRYLTCGDKTLLPPAIQQGLPRTQRSTLPAECRAEFARLRVLMSPPGDGVPHPTGGSH
jgi:hypothetical protein